MTKIMPENVDLGFAENCEAWQVESRMFPSKLGGKPAWLDLEKLPTCEDLTCNKCEDQLIFLCQVYAPYEDDENNFHRTIFVFVCRNSACSQRNVNDNIKAFRSHLRRENKFYPFEAPAEKPDPDFDLRNYVSLCNVCGCFGTKHCGKCKKAVYCCREHQITDWKESHKDNCGANNSALSTKLFPQFELVMEPEEIVEKAVDETEELQKFEEMEKDGKTGTMKDVPDKDLEQHAIVNDDKVFRKFKKRIDHYPDQVLRYERDGEPLWIAEHPKPDSVPNCEYCGGPRRLEFQIMPQLLTVLGEHEIDWGVLCIYSCKISCTLDNSYKAEFVFKQDCTDAQITN